MLERVERALNDLWTAFDHLPLQVPPVAHGKTDPICTEIALQPFPRMFKRLEVQEQTPIQAERYALPRVFEDQPTDLRLCRSQLMDRK